MKKIVITGGTGRFGKVLRRYKTNHHLIYPNKRELDILNALKDNKKGIRYLLGRELNTKFVPDLRFYYDDTLKKAEKIGTLLNKINKKEI